MEKKKEDVPRLSISYSDYFSHIGKHWHDVYFMDMAKSSPDVLVREVKRILNVQKES